MASWGPIALTAVTASLLALPVAPALFELQKRRDAAPLTVSRHSGRTENFAESFQSRLEPLLPELERCRAKNEVTRISIDGLEALLVGRDDFNFSHEDIGPVEAIMLAHPTIVPAGCEVSVDLYAASTLELGAGAIVRAALSIGDVTLCENSSVLRWLHSRGNVRLRHGSAVKGRLSAEEWIALSGSCRFLRVSAPEIVTADDIPAPGRVSQRKAIEGHNLHSEYAASAARRHRVRGDFVLPAGETLNGDIIATGEVRIGAGAQLRGSIKSYKDVVIEDDASVNGSIVGEKSLRLGRRSYAAGPIMAERGVVIDGESRIGEPDCPTTISSASVEIAAGCRIHGTIWAREQGSIES